MPIPLPNLDDRRWTDLVDEGRSLIPVYSDEWTDFNPSDPGITLLELFAWIAEMDIYQINRIPDRHKRKFLELIGVIPEPPRPAQTGLAFTVTGPDPVSIPAGTELLATHLAAIQTSDGAVLQDVTAMIPGNGLPPFGAPPKINSAIYFGFDAPLPADRAVEIELRFAPAPPGPAPTAVIAWEFLDHLGVWSALAVDDSTSMLSIDGRIRITGVPHFRAVALGHVAGPLYYIRARYTGGSFHPGIKLVGASETGFTTSNLVFRTVDDFTAAPGALQAIQTSDGTTFRDFTASFPGEPLWPFGVPPVLDAAIYFGFDQPLPPKHIASLMFHFAGGPVAAGAGRHHSASIAWEYLNTFGWWATLQVDDSTRSFSADGEARIAAPAKMRKSAIGRVAAPLFYIRARHEGGQYDMPPKLLSVAWNAVEAEQAQAVTQEWLIAPGTIASGAAPAPGDVVSVLFGFNASDQIDTISFDTEADPEFWVVKYTAAGATTAGVMALELLLVAAGTGGPGQHVLLAGGPSVVESTVRLYSLENGAWRTWAMRLTFDSSTASDSHFLLDAQTGDVQFGDGNRGRVLPENALLFASYSKTAAALGTPEPGLRMTSAIAGLGSIQCVFPAQAGADTEPLGSAIGRAVSGREAPLRAITLSDYEALARSTPGTSIARVAARANFYPELDAFEALGIVTVIVVPNMPVPMPRPSAGLLYAVRRYLNARRTIGTRVEVVGPTYLQVAVSATVQSGKGQNQTRLKQAILDALNYFLDPLTGGPDRTGWPFGRDVYETEILQVLAQTPGVDHVKNLALTPKGCEPSCGNICVKPNWLVTPGAHQIEVL